MHFSVARSAECYQVSFGISSRVTPVLHVMNMQVLPLPAGLASPIVPLEDLPMQSEVTLLVKLKPRVFGWDYFHEAAAQSRTKIVVFGKQVGTDSSEKSHLAGSLDCRCPGVRQQ